LQHEQKYEEAIENCKKALKGEGEIMPTIPLRIERLEKVVNAKPNSKEWKAALWELLEDKRGPAVRCFQECNMARIVKWYITVSTSTIASPPKRRERVVTRARKLAIQSQTILETNGLRINTGKCFVRALA
jgi:hypothetical protein